MGDLNCLYRGSTNPRGVYRGFDWVQPYADEEDEEEDEEEEEEEDDDDDDDDDDDVPTHLSIG